MPIIKSWNENAYFIKFGRISLWYDAETQMLNWHRGFEYLDENENLIVSNSDVEFGIAREMQGSMAWADIPANIQDALLAIDQYTKDQIRLQEGLDGS